MLLDADNCGDTYPTADISLAGWISNGSCTIVSGAGRAGGNAIVNNTINYRRLGRTVSPQGSARHLFHGFAYRTNLGAAYDVVSIHDPNGVQHLTLGVNPSGVMTMYRGANGGASLGICSLPLIGGAYKFIEVEAYIADGDGVARVWIDDILALEYLGDTRNGGAALWSALSYINYDINTGGGYDIRYDDWYVCDDQGLPPWNTRLSDVSVMPHNPTGVGNSTTWTRGGTDSGANWSQVDEGVPNGDVDYVTAVLQGKLDLYKFQALRAPGHTILGVQSVIHARKVDAGTASVGCSFRHGGVDYNPATGEPLGLDYRYTKQMFQMNPAGGAWSEAAFNAIEAGPYKNS